MLQVAYRRLLIASPLQPLSAVLRVHEIRTVAWLLNSEGPV